MTADATAEPKPPEPKPISPSMRKKLERRALWTLIASGRKTIRRSGALEDLKGRNRNRPCYCGSGKKYKRCHADSERAIIKEFITQGNKKEKEAV